MRTFSGFLQTEYGNRYESVLIVVGYILFFRIMQAGAYITLRMPELVYLMCFRTF